MDGAGEVEPSQFRSLVAALSYGVASMAMVFINKAILMKYAYSMTLLMLQQVATAALIYLGRARGYTKSNSLNLTIAKKLLPVSIFYNANVAFALASLKGVNIPMYIALKRLTPLAVLVAGFFSGKGRPAMQVSLSVLVIAFGVIIAAIGDFSFDLFGYTMALTSVFFQTMYLVLVEKSGAEEGLSSVDIMLYNAVLSLPFLLFLIIATGEFPQSLSLLIEKAHSVSFFLVFILSLVMGILLNFTMFLCTIVNSALTTTIVGVLKGVGSTELPPSPAVAGPQQAVAQYPHHRLKQIPWQRNPSPILQPLVASLHLLRPVFAGGIHAQPEEAAAGAILRDSQDQLIQAFGCSLSTYAVDVAELYGAYLAIQLTKSWIGKLHGLWLEGDSETIITLLNTALRHKDVQELSSTFAIIALLLSFPSVRISHVYRQANQAAHYITSASFTHDVFWDRDMSLPFNFSAILL